MIRKILIEIPHKPSHHIFKLPIRFAAEKKLNSVSLEYSQYQEGRTFINAIFGFAESFLLHFIYVIFIF